MKIKSLNIKNFKSIVDLTINEPNPFTVFVGPNGSGKSNIFEALEFFRYVDFIGDFEESKSLNSSIDFISMFGGKEVISNRIINENQSNYDISLIEENGSTKNFKKTAFLEENLYSWAGNSSIEKWIREPLRIFVNNFKNQKIINNGNSTLSLSGDNLEKVLKRLLEDEIKREEISDWLSLFIPEFDRIEVQKNQNNSNKEDLLIYQKHYEQPFDRDLISDGTFNIIAILTAVFQSDEPQFLCIEEPENGLNPKVIRELVNLFRDACEMYGHYIWINTHSQTLVSQLTEKELIIVDKIRGETKIKQFKEGDFFGLPADEALLTNALGGGIPW